MSIKEIDEKIEALKEKRKPLFEKRDNLNDSIMKISKQIEKLRIQREKEEMALPKTEQEEMEYFLFEDGLVNGERYKAREKYWETTGLWRSGYYPEIDQVCLKIMMYKGLDDNLEQTIETLEKVIPLLKEREGVKRLGVFENTLSENGSYEVEISGNEYSLMVYRWGRKSVVKSFDNVRDLVKYIQEFHYYESTYD